MYQQFPPEFWLHLWGAAKGVLDASPPRCIHFKCSCRSGRSKSFFVFDIISDVSDRLVMKTKRGRQQRKMSAKKIAPKIASTPATAPAKEPVSTLSVAGPPPPDVLFQWAEQEPNYRTLAAYADSIGVLRDKGFSYRQIADWFSEHGVDADHNAVYRVYANSLSDFDAHLEAEREKEDALQEAMRNS
jgi:hypothetical protein